MEPVAGLTVMLLLGAADVQRTVVPSATPRTPSAQADPGVPAQRPAADPAAPRIEFLGKDGKPLSLPPDVQRQLEDDLRKSPPPVGVARSPGDFRAGDILVTALRGSVMSDIPPQRIFGPLDIRAFGASNVEEFLQALGPQLSSNRGREGRGPVTLLNGRRVSDFSEIARIPTEAIERTEIFPEEVALKYGYRADQKVVNIITFARFKSRVGQLNYLLLGEGGRDTPGIIADYFAISGDTRYSIGADYDRSGSLLESERGVVQPSGTPDLGRFRTLLPEARRLARNGLVSGTVLNGVSSTLNARIEAVETNALLGLGFAGPLLRNSDTRTVGVGTTQFGRISKWTWAVTGDYTRISTHVLTDTGIAGRRDDARSVDALANADVVLAGAVLELPAGPLFTSVRGGIDVRDFTSTAQRSGVAERTALSRDRGTVQINLDLPILGKKEAPSPLGRLSANANFAVERLSDFGTLRTIGYGVSWSPVNALNLIVSATGEEAAPRVEQLGGPTIVTPNVRTFDVTRREVVDVTRIFGGNPNLRPDDRHVVKIGLNAQPLSATDLVLSIDYVSTRIDNPIAPFPILTPEIEAAFPDRFTRGANGRLLEINDRPLNFARSQQQQLRLGISFTRPLGPLPLETQSAGRVFASEADVRRAYPGARVFVGAPGSPLARRAENVSSRLFASLYHNLVLEDSIVTRESGPILNLLDGDAIDFRGGRPQHEIELQAGAFKRGLGLKVTANWRSGTRVDDRGNVAGNLHFESLATVNINLFANLAERFAGGAASAWWSKGARATLGISNLFNARPQVHDGTGTTPLSYQPAYLDPLGRSIVFSLRKVF